MGSAPGLELISRKLRVTRDRIGFKSLFFERSVPFSSIDQIRFRVADPEEPDVVSARFLAYDGQSITIRSNASEYRAVFELLQNHAGSKIARPAHGDPDFS